MKLPLRMCNLITLLLPPHQSKYFSLLFLTGHPSWTTLKMESASFFEKLVSVHQWTWLNIPRRIFISTTLITSNLKYVPTHEQQDSPVRRALLCMSTAKMSQSKAVTRILSIAEFFYAQAIESIPICACMCVVN
jgi:hypothetical protein